MGKKKNKSRADEKVSYLVQHTDDEGPTWWNEITRSWTDDPHDATVYHGPKMADKVVDKFNHLLNGYNTIDGIQKDEVLDNLSRPRITFSEKKITPSGFIVRRVSSLGSNSNLSFGMYWSDDDRNWTSSQGNATVYPTEDEALTQVGRNLKDKIISEAIPLSLEENTCPGVVPLSPGTVLLDKVSPSFPTPLLITHISDDGRVVTLAEEGTVSESNLFHEDMDTIMERIAEEDYQILWDPNSPVLPEQPQQENIPDEDPSIVPGCVILGPGETTDDKPYMVDHITRDEVFFLYPGSQSHKIFSIEFVESELESGDWEVVYDPRGNFVGEEECDVP
jgi:hypothetical protein